MDNMLRRHGFENFVRCPGYVRGNDDPFDACSMAHLRAMEMLPKDGPVLILEDDCIDQNYVDTITVPDDVDIVYLGIHISGADISRLGKPLVPQYSRVNETTWRVLNTLSAHAILYVTDAGKQLVHRALKMSLETGVGADEAMAYVQPLLHVYAPDQPLWYQYDYPELTKYSVSEVNELEFSSGGAGGGCSDFPQAFT